jgi:hypothetical protein
MQTVYIVVLVLIGIFGLGVGVYCFFCREYLIAFYEIQEEYITPIEEKEKEIKQIDKQIQSCENVIGILKSYECEDKVMKTILINNIFTRDVFETNKKFILEEIEFLEKDMCDNAPMFFLSEYIEKKVSWKEFFQWYFKKI